MPITYNDPIHGRIVIPDAFRVVVESPVLARLRNVRQLGFTLARYPGAVHTRFEHTLGTVAILLQLMRQLGNHDISSQNRFILAALLTEIGTPPFSYSTRLIFQKYGLSRPEYASGLYTNYLRPELGSSLEEEKFLFESNLRKESWFGLFAQYEEYSYLDPVKLSSTIDYVLRDSYYTGRYVGGFDYRFFSSLWFIDKASEREALQEGLRSLHRSVHALNAIYGDPVRRMLSILLTRLVDRLVERGFINFTFLKDERSLLSLDDDEFLYQIGLSVSRATDAGDKEAKRIYDTVTQRVTPQLRMVSLRALNISPEEDTESVRSKVADSLNCLPSQVVLLDTRYHDNLGFRMFGKEFRSYEDAVSSEVFQRCTGLVLNDDVVRLSRDKLLVFLI